LDFAHVDAKENLVDGASFLTEDLGNNETMSRALYWHYPHFSNQGGRPKTTIRMGRYKLIHSLENGNSELYDLLTDPGEKTDLSEQQTALTQVLHDSIAQWLVRVEAPMPKKKAL